LRFPLPANPLSSPSHPAPSNTDAPCNMSANTAVKKGVPDPTAWLKLTGMYLRLMLPSTMVMQKMVASRQTFHSCLRDLRGRMGNDLVRDSA